MSKEDQRIKNLRAMRLALFVSAERALENGIRLVDVGQPDINRGQFVALVEGGLLAAEAVIQDVETQAMINRLEVLRLR